MKAEHSTTALCEALSVSASGYYDWEARKTCPSGRALEDQQLQSEIARIHRESRQTYGAPRVQAQLRGDGLRHGRNRIARLMREQSLCGREKKRYRVMTTDSRHDEPIAPNRLPQVVASAPNQVWVADITYVSTTAKSWVYVAAILDLYSRKVVGWSVSQRIDTALVSAALDMALCFTRIGASNTPAPITAPPWHRLAWCPR